MAKRVNKPAVAILTLALMAMTVAAGLLIIMALPGGDPAPMVKRAEQALSKGDYETAIVSYMHAYRRSKDPKYLVLAGDVARKMGDAQRAFGLWQRAIMADPQYAEPRERSVNLWLEILKLQAWQAPSATWARLAKDADALLKIEPDNTEALFARGLAYINLKAEKPEYTEQGLKDLLAVLEKRPDDQRVLSILGNYYLSEGQEEKARKLYEETIKRFPDKPVGYLLLGRFLTSKGDLEGAIANLTKAVSLSGGASEPRVALARAYMLKRQFDRAEQILQETVKSDPDAYDAYLQLCQLYVSSRKPDKALETAQQWLSRPPIRKGFKAALYKNQRVGMLVQAALACVGMAAEAQDKQQREQWIERVETYRQEIIREAGQELPWTYLLAGHVNRLKGQIPDAIKAFEVADREFGGKNAQVKINLAELYYRHGEIGAARKVLRELVERLTPTYAPAYRMLGYVEAALGNYATALTYLDRGLALQPDDQEMLILKATLLRRTGRAAEAEAIEKKLGKPKTLRDKLRRAAQMLAEGRADEAVEIYREVLAVDPANVAALRPLLQILIQRDRRDEAKRIFEKARAAAPDNPRVRELEVLLLTDLTPQQREQRLLEIIKSEPDEFLRNLQLFFFYYTKGQYDKAQAIADTLEKLAPDDPRVINLQFNLALVRDDWNRAERYAALAGQKNLDGAQGGFYSARISMGRRQWQKAYEQLRQALNTFPTHSRGWVWLGQTLLNLRRYSEARAAFERALELNPNMGEAYRGLAQLALLEQDRPTFERYLARAYRLMPTDPWVVQQMGRLLDEKDPRKAIERRERILERRPDDIDNMLRLARLYERTDQEDKALQVLQRALQASPKNVNVAWQLAMFYQRNDQPEKAEKVLLDLVESAADNDTKALAYLALGNLYQIQGLPEKAEQAYLLAVRTSNKAEICLQLAEFYRGAARIKEATEWYKRALIAPDAESLDEASVRQRLIEMLLQARLLDEAAKQIEEYHKVLPNDPKYLLMRGTLRILRGSAEQALADLSEFLRQSPDSAVGHYHRGLLYMAMNRFPQAIDDLTKAKMLRPSGFNFEHRIALAQALEASGQTDRAIAELKAVLDEYPDATAVAKALVAIYRRAGRWKDLEALARAFMSKQPSDWTWPAILGQVGEATGDYAKAIEGYSKAVQVSSYAPEPVDSLLRAYIAAGQYDTAITFALQRLPERLRGSPQVKIRLAEAYYKKGQKAKALQLYDQILEKADNIGIALVTVRSLADTVGTDEALKMLRQRVKASPDNLVLKYMLAAMLAETKRLDEALQVSGSLVAQARKPQEKAMFLRQYGALLYRSGRHEEAAKAYEQLLEVSPDDSNALNNLAYILAEDLKRPKEALPYAKRAATLNPKDANVLDTLGWVYYLTGDYDQALGSLLAALEQQPANVAARYHIAMVYKARGRLDLARRELEHARQVVESSKNDPIAAMFEDKIEAELKAMGVPAGSAR